VVKRAFAVLVNVTLTSLVEREGTGWSIAITKVLAPATGLRSQPPLGSISDCISGRQELLYVQKKFPVRESSFIWALKS
jgi:hypothetical protein